MDRSLRWWALTAVSLATFMTYLDNNVVNVALPTIQSALGLSLSGLEWIVSSYILVFAGLMLVGGRLADVYGRRRVFLAGLAVFTAASLAAGLADTGTILIASRALQGVGAALLMANLQASFRAWVETGVDVPTLTKRLNQTVVRSNQINKFVSFFTAEIDGGSGAVTYCNAGHNPPYLVRADGALERLRTGGLILGVLPNSDFDHGAVRLGPGDLLMMYSDGLTESTDPSDEMFGEERLEAFLRAHHALPVDQMQDRLHDAPQRFTPGAPPADDPTLGFVQSE